MKLAAFTATAKAPYVQLNWRTASEKKSARFEVERRLDGSYSPVRAVTPDAPASSWPFA